MKQIKRVVSLLLCAILICALTAPAFAGNGFINLERGTFTNNQTFYNRGPFDNYGTLNNNATFDTSGGKINSYGSATQTGVETTSVNKYYTVSFNTDGSGYVSPQTVIANGTATEPSPAPTQNGCSLEGWYLDKDCANKYNFDEPITENLTLYAKWTEITFTANWDASTPGVISWSPVSSANEIKVVMQNTADSSISQTLSGTATSLDLRKYLCDGRLNGDFTVTVSALDAQGNTIVDASALSANRTIDTDTIDYAVSVGSTEDSLNVKVQTPGTTYVGTYVGYAWKYIYSTEGNYNPGFSTAPSFTVSTAEHSLASGNSMNVVGIKSSIITEETGIWEVKTTADSQKSYDGTAFVDGSSGSSSSGIFYVTGTQTNPSTGSGIYKITGYEDGVPTTISTNQSDLFTRLEQGKLYGLTKDESTGYITAVSPISFMTMDISEASVITYNGMRWATDNSTKVYHLYNNADNGYGLEKKGTSDLKNSTTRAYIIGHDVDGSNVIDTVYYYDP